MTNDYTIPQREVLAQLKANQLAQELGMTHAGDKDCRATITHTGSGTRVVVQRLTDGISRSFKFTDSPSTAEQVDSAQVERPSAEVGVRYMANGLGVYDSGYCFATFPPGAEQTVAELVRRANALPEVEAQLAEAVELLRQIGECYDVSRDIGCHACREEIDAFLAKVDAP